MFKKLKLSQILS